MKGTLSVSGSLRHSQRVGRKLNDRDDREASQKLAHAAEVIAKEPAAMHLRFLQSLVEVSAENNSDHGRTAADRPIKALSSIV